MKHHFVTNRNAPSDNQRESLVSVKHAVILNIAVLANDDLILITTQNNTKPDTATTRD